VECEHTQTHNTSAGVFKVLYTQANIFKKVVTTLQTTKNKSTEQQ